MRKALRWLLALTVLIGTLSTAGAVSTDPFRLGHGARDSYVFTAPGLNHGAKVAGLVPDEKALATARILQWPAWPPRRSRRTRRRPNRWRGTT